MDQLVPNEVDDPRTWGMLIGGSVLVGAGFGAFLHLLNGRYGAPIGGFGMTLIAFALLFYVVIERPHDDQD